MGAKASKGLGDIPLAYYIAKDTNRLKDQTIPDEVKTLSLGDLPSLSNLAMCSYNLVRLSPHIGALKSMLCIQMCCNQLRSIPREIGHLSNLTLLDLSKNKLKNLPDTIGCLSKLLELKLNHNELTALPASIGMLSKLTLLSASNNNIKYIPRECEGLVALNTLDLSNNPLSALPAEVGQLQFLRRLRLEGCHLHTEEDLAKMASHEPRQPLLSLKEMAARAVVKGRMYVPLQHLPPRVTHYFLTVQTCSFCHGPYFDHVSRRGRIIEKNDQKIPLEYRLCSPHWHSDTERVSLLFCGSPEFQPCDITMINRRRSKDHRNRQSTSSLPGSIGSFAAPRRRTLLSRLGGSSPPSSGTSSPASVTLLTQALEKIPQLPQLPEGGSVSRLSLHRRSFISTRRSLSIYVP